MSPKTPEETERMSRDPSRSAVESLMYDMVCTRPDIYQAVGLVSRYQTDPGLAHWQAVKRIMRYLKGTADYAFCYQGCKDLRLVGYSDADHGGDLDERKSTSGYIFLLSDGAISWSSKKKSCVSLSTMEAEYVALASAAQEVVWSKMFLEHLLDIAKNTEPVLVYSDSEAAISSTKDPKFHCKTKHIDIKYNYARDMVRHKVVNVKYVSIKDMLADPLIKPLSRDAFVRHIRSQGLRRL
ncbi:secreted RxLR effector protein 161-like [Nicotiana tomentosiformis]|uniref:secreted RxLR effector protein 161-like n=1 Tax=Nicotiana tomentosiformis TaxID=4098 RepID=UPI0014460A38|nr:secreted RxLR effector protein 161-like [Nicotiana tomentosiformis]